MAWLSWFRSRREDQKAGQGLPVATPVDERLTQGNDADTEGQFLWLEGRRHLTTVPYLLPKDGQEVNRLDFQHYMVRYALQRNYIAPIDNPRGILDTGCGTGRWAQEMAVAFPRAKVFGMDILAESPEPTTIPVNYRYVQGDILKEIPFPDMTFDFVHQRFMHLAIPVDRWVDVARELARVTRPGGWVEMVESDLVMRNTGPATQQLTRWGFDLSRKRNIDPRVCAQTPHFLHAAGLINIQKYRLDMPIGSWGKRLGIMAVTDLYAFNRALKPLVLAQYGVSSAEFDALTNAMRQEWEQHHSVFSIYLVCGQRP